MTDLPFRTLLYRYFFFGWLFQELTPGANLFERAAARRRNRQQARWLPTYILRWFKLALVFYGLGGLGALVEVSAGVEQLLYALSAVCVAISVMTTTAWVGLTRGEEVL